MTPATALPSLDLSPVRLALLSVHDKTGLVELATGLRRSGVELLASGGTARVLTEAGIPVTQVDAFTEAPEILDGRVKTLHPKIHAGLLADRRAADHMQQMAARGYPSIDLVVCNLYPFADMLARGAEAAALIEMIDIGGPSLLRAAAKNLEGGTTVIVSPAEYPALLAELHQQGGISLAPRRRWAAQAFRHVVEYDALIADWLDAYAGSPPTIFPHTRGDLVRTAGLRYGENPQQAAYLYTERNATTGVAQARALQGKALSYNNYLDLDAAYRAVYPLGAPACAIIKHRNPCGLCAAERLEDAFVRALATDPVAAFGSVVAFNRPFDERTALALRESKLFVECIIAPAITAAAHEVLRDRANLRLIEAPPGSPAPSWMAHRIGGGLLVQQTDPGPYKSQTAWRVVTQRPLAAGWEDELRFAMHAAAGMTSNAIAVTRDRCLLGAGVGHVSRIEAAELALKKAGDQARGAFLASDAFFPFADCVRLAHAAGIAAIVQPGGSIRDAESIAACDELGLAMVFTSERHFRH
jgi:phosphoribosylaminoimidazolecarboxamide formyltransferase/IMP cyclohydrolase